METPSRTPDVLKINTNYIKLVNYYSDKKIAV
jgi:hypothetical protein